MVPPKLAKTIKNSLEENKWLNKKVKIWKHDATAVAIPVTPEGAKAIDQSSDPFDGLPATLAELLSSGAVTWQVGLRKLQPPTQKQAPNPSAKFTYVELFAGLLLQVPTLHTC